ncbi:MAG: hypothetical protein ABI353_00445 [Isosphaeraceae bacterium]
MIPAKLMAVGLATLVNLAFVLLAGAAQDGSRDEGNEAAGDRLTRATRVTLDFDNAPVAEVARTIGERSGKRIQKLSDAGTMGINGNADTQEHDWQNRRVTLKTAEPVPFWEAVDRLCEAAKIGYRMSEFGETGSETSGLVFEESDRRTGGLVRYVGPFRVALTGLHEHREVLFVQGPRVRVYANMFTPHNAADLKSAPLDGGPRYAELRLMAEPGLICRRSGPLIDLAATDNQGRSLLDSSAEERMARADPYADFLWGTSAPLRIPLNRPTGSDRTIHQLRGTIPVEIAVVKDKPALVIPLQGTPGKEFQGAGAVFKVETFSTGLDSQMSLSFTARLLDDLRSPRLRESRLWSLSTHQYRVVDAKGKDVRFQTYTRGGDGQESISLKFTYDYRGNGSTPGAGPPAEVLVYDLDRVSWSVPFAFQDIPRP